jgi:hypothetical protein
MLHFSSPFWLISLLAVAVPVAIHLLSRRAGKKIKVGSIRFLEASPSHRRKSLKLGEIPLLLLRVALIAVLALLLAQPFWQQKRESEPRGWIFVAAELLPNLSRAHQHLIDSLVAAGFGVMNGGIGGINPSWSGGFSRLAPLSPMVHHRVTVENNVWSLLREADAHTPIWIFASDRLASIQGERPALHTTINWHTVPNSRQNRWIHEAHLAPTDSLHLVIGFSEARQTVFARYLLKAPNQPAILSNSNMPAIEVIPHPENRAYTLRLVEPDADPADNRREIFRDDDPMIIAIIHDDQRRDDARYVQSALAAAAEFDQIALAIKPQLIGGNEQDWKTADYAFWLADQPVPPVVLEQVERGLVLISDAGTQPYERCESRIVMGDENIENSPRLWRRVAPSKQGLILWMDGVGQPLLECQRQGTGYCYRFHSRFHPLWNELVFSPNLPEWTLKLLHRENLIARDAGLATRHFDERRISAAQLLPARKTAATVTPKQAAHRLHLPFWILAILLFVLERWVAERKSP